jgi:hypothetical protein
MRLTINKSWDGCMTQWDWMIRRLKKDDTLDVENLKNEWCEKNGYEVGANSFFCEYAATHGVKSDECNCPAKKIDKYFNCLDKEYNYEHHPFKFYKKLQQLNRIRLKGK